MGIPPAQAHKCKRMAAAVHNDQIDHNSAQNLTTTQPSSIALALSLEQHSQLMQLLSKYSSNMENTSENGDIGATGFLAGKRYCMLISLAHKTWILDNGASDHITPNLSLLHC